MNPETFRFKQFNLIQDDSVFKVGTDGVVLGAWVETSGTNRVLDIGTGTGLIALMIAQKTKDTVIDAIEIQEESCSLAKSNFESSPWSDRLNIFHAPLQNFISGSKNRYDLIVTNPPFFIESLKNPSGRKSVSRHSDSLSMKEILEGTSELLAPQGKLSIIYPCKEAEIFRKLAQKSGLVCRRRMFLKPIPQKEPVRTLMEFGFEQIVCADEELTIEKGQRHHYTDEFKSLTGEFYLYFLH